MANQWYPWQYDMYYGIEGTATDQRDEYYPTQDYDRISGWRLSDSRHRGTDGIAMRPANYVPFQSLYCRDGRYAYDPSAEQYPRYATGGHGGSYGANHYSHSAPGFPVNQIIELQMRDQPDYGIGQYYDGYGGYGQMYGYGSPYGPGGEWGNHGWW